MCACDREERVCEIDNIHHHFSQARTYALTHRSGANRKSERDRVLDDGDAYRFQPPLEIDVGALYSDSIGGGYGGEGRASCYP